MKRLHRILAVSSHLMFWGWNLAFLTFAYVGILPFLVPVMVVEGWAGLVPLDMVLAVISLILIPTVGTLIGFLRFRSQPGQLVRLFYGIEAPLFMLGLLRLFLFRDLSWGVSLVVLTAIIAILTFALDVLGGSRLRSPALDALRLSANSVMVLAGLGMGLLLAFYSVPVAVFLIQVLAAAIISFFQFGWLRELAYIWDRLFWSTLFMGLALSSAAVLVAMPIALTVFYLQSGWRLMQTWGTRYGIPRVRWVSATIMAVWLLGVSQAQIQPQTAAFDLLTPAPTTMTARQAQMTASETIRQGLLNAYLLSYRYLSPQEDNRHVFGLYRQLGWPESWAEGLQAVNNVLLSPFLYQGSRQDSEKAATLYGEFFDVPIQKAERQAILHALQSTFNREEAKAGVLNIDAKTVRLADQEVTVNPHGDWAEVEIHEHYENTTPEQQEVFYAFSLPESTVITGLWLGDTDNRDQRFPFVVAPRGAAQQVYTQEVRRQVDPALLEQVGPQQYRLRAFPVPPTTRSESLTAPATPGSLHLWLTYTTLAQPNGWPLPQLSEKRNLFWNRATRRTFNGKTVPMPNTELLADWLPAVLNADPPVSPSLHQFRVIPGQRLQARPLGLKDYRLPTGQRLAVFVDSSRSMAAHTGELRESLLWLQQLVIPKNQVDLWVIPAAGIPPQAVTNPAKLTPDQITFYGHISLRQMIESFAAVVGSPAYDAIVILTDEGSYELNPDLPDLPVPPAPLWVVHLGSLPSAYDDPVLAAIQDSGGGLAHGVQEALQRWATETSLGSSGVSVSDGYAWTMVPDQGSLPAQSGLDVLAARQQIRALTKAQPQRQLADLDAIHALAQRYGIVTPYSSMLVLVNDQQREALRQAAAAPDRFLREVETGSETLSQPLSPLGDVSAVPEPEEWLLMSVASLGVILLWRYRRRHTQTKA